jgi:hypothetical protein
MWKKKTTTDMPDPMVQLTELKRRQECPVLVERFPHEGATYTLGEALRRAGEVELADQLAKALDVAEVQAAMVQTPILAVLGELNAGKSSVVAGFLSPAGRRRIPRGVANAQGTHRFVYWVPAAWQRGEKLGDAFRKFLEVVHGEEVHFLSEDSDEAARQYRSGRDHAELIRIPLVAYDAALDEVSAAFLDCPDVQTLDRDASESSRVNMRLEFVANAARLCSAFILIWERAKIRDRLLTEYLDKLRHRMAQVPLFLLINKIRAERDQPAATLRDEDLQRIRERFDITRVYIAYDFDIEARGDQPGWRELTPPALVERAAALGESDHDRFPQFFQASDSQVPPSQVPPHDFFEQLPRQLDLAELQRQAVVDHLAESFELSRQGIGLLRAWVQQRNEQTRRAHAGLLAFCLERFTNPSDGEPYQIPETAFTSALSESFLRTAPWYLRPGLWLHGRFHGVAESVRAGSGRVRRILKGFSSFYSWPGSEKRMEEDLARAGLPGTRVEDPATLAAAMHAQRWVPVEVSEEQLKAGWERTLREFSRFRLTIDPHKLDEMTGDFWNSLSRGQRIKAFLLLGVLTLMGTIAAVGGLLVAAVDGGATLFASYSLAAAVSAAVPGLPAIGVAVVGTGGAFAGFMLGAVTQNTLPALAAFFRLACDAFGLPDRLEGDQQTPVVTFGRKVKKQFPLPRIDVPPLPPVCPLPSLGVWEMGDEVARYEKGFDRGN